MGDIIGKMGGMDVLIISAGVGFDNPDFNWKPEKLTIDVNVAGFAEVLNIGYAYFSKQKSGHIVGISSIAGIRGIGAYPAYSASKAFVSNYLEALRKKTKKERRAIIVTDIVPGYVDTAMASGNNLFWVAKVEKAANQIIKAIDRKAAVAYVTRRCRLIAWALRFMPRILYDTI